MGYERIYQDGMKVQRTLYIDEYGEKLSVDQRILGKGEKRFIYILTKEGSIAVNMKMKYAAKRKNPPELLDEEALCDWFIEILYGKRREKIMNPETWKGVEKILDKECSIYDLGDEKYWIWNNIILKWERKSFTQNVKNIQIDVSIPAEKFKVPKGVWVFPKIF